MASMLSCEKCGDKYNETVLMLSQSPFKPLELTTPDNKKISLLFRRESPSRLTRIEKLIGGQYNCYYCRIRAKQLFSLSDVNNRHLFFDEDSLQTVCSSDPTNAECYRQINQECNDLIKQEPIVGLYILHGKYIYDFKPSGDNPDFIHWHREIPLEQQSESSLTEEAIKGMQMVIHRYLYDGHMLKMIRKIATPSVEQGLFSLTLMETCCQNATYGDKFLPAVRWLKNILSELKGIGKEFNHLSESERWSFFAKHLLSLNISKDLNGYVCLVYQTAHNNIVDLLGTANSVPAMTKMIEERLNPHNYQRRDPDKVLSTQQINTSQNILGDFENTIMTIPQISKLIPKAVVLSIPDNTKSATLSAFDKMREESSKKDTHSAGGFAARSGFSKINDEINKISSFSQLIEFIRVNPTTTLKIHHVGDVGKCFVAETTLSSEKLAVPHFWAFSNGICNFPPSLDNYHEVSAIVPIYQYTNFNNIIFTIKNTISRTKSNCCFPEFLSPEYRRVCGPAFEKLGKMVPITIPSDGPLAFGIGFSAPNETKKLNRPIKFLINGISKEISDY